MKIIIKSKTRRFYGNVLFFMSRIFGFRLIFFLFVFFTTASYIVHAQQATNENMIKVEILNADRAVNKASLGRTDMFGNVAFKHDSVTLSCDSAYFYDVHNSFEAFGNAHLRFSDTLNLYSERINYSGNLRIAKATKNVILQDNTKTLYTDTLDYYRDFNYGYYPNHGRIIDDENTLLSIHGFYYTKLKEIHFQDSVVLFNEENKLLSDTLVYFTDTKVAKIVGPTHIYGKNGRYMYCELGWYNTLNDDSDVQKNIYATEDDRITKCQRATYDSKTQIGRFYDRIEMIDTTQNVIIKGEYGEYHRSRYFGFLVDSAMAIIVDDRHDSLFMHADTLFMRMDTTNSITHLLAYHKTKFFKSDLQGACDSIAFVMADSTMRMYTMPILWAEKSQLTSDSIYFFMHDNSIDSILFYGNGFIISSDTTDTYNQVKGRLVTAYFVENEIKKIVVNGNAESLYYIRDDDKELIGIDKAVAAMLYIMIEDNEFKSVTYINGATAVTYPEKEIAKPDLKLKGFKLQTHRKPLSKEDIFK